ncbi:MAG: aspartate/glutamate racemase family protein [Candidatus Aminicenantes bacterium]|nr:aspartate/glutamate racemase family protein [Candidatus Aminicenantes bacterium]
MKTIGLVGGMSWESTLEYYRIINERTKEKLGGFHSAKIVLYSVDFGEVESWQHQGKWKALTDLMIDAARRVERAGADLLAICTNTMHKMADDVQQSIRIPLLHIVDATAAEIKGRSIRKVGLLGTRFTMEQDFYKQRLSRDDGPEVIIPDERERELIHGILYNELCLGEIKDASKDVFQRIIAGLVSRGAQGIVLGCTEIPLLVNQKDYDIPLFDTTTIHACAAVDMALI